jgi:thymidylate synthase
MHEDCCRDGMHDFMCTISNQFLIRDNTLWSIYNIRSNDAVFGFFNDFYWACYVYKQLYQTLALTYPELKYGPMIWFAGSFHIYERHFNLLREIVEKGKL